MSNHVYIASSLDGFIADKNNQLDWLEMVPNPEQEDFGFADFISGIDAIVMGRNTYETVIGFPGDWPYTKPVFVYSRTLTTVAEKCTDSVEIIQGSAQEVSESLAQRGFQNLYIDGGQTIQSFLEADLIDEMIITRIPVLLGGGVPLFSDLKQHLEFDHVSTEVLLDQMVCSRYKRKQK